ncbi:MAG: hypothetical protein OXG65_08670 [Chloroflexi bacterium]|nr:hypothetical protein [Chloroflexota bacterium]
MEVTAIESLLTLASAAFLGATFPAIVPQSVLIFILTHLTAATLVTLTHHLLAASNRSPWSTPLHGRDTDRPQGHPHPSYEGSRLASLGGDRV